MATSSSYTVKEIKGQRVLIMANGYTLTLANQKPLVKIAAKQMNETDTRILKIATAQ